MCVKACCSKHAPDLKIDLRDSIEIFVVNVVGHLCLDRSNVAAEIRLLTQLWELAKCVRHEVCCVRENRVPECDSSALFCCPQRVNVRGRHVQPLSSCNARNTICVRVVLSRVFAVNVKRVDRQEGLHWDGTA